MSDDFEYMLAFVSRAQAKELQEQKMRQQVQAGLNQVAEGEDDPTVSLARQARAQKRQENMSKEQQRLYELTVKNMETARREFEAAVLNDKEIQVNGNQKEKKLKKISFDAGEKEAEKLFSVGKFKESLEVWMRLLQQYGSMLREQPKKTLPLLLAMGKAYVANQDLKLAISCLQSALFIAEQQNERSVQLEVLGLLATCCEDLGKISDATQYREKITALSGKKVKVPKETPENEKPVAKKNGSVSAAEEAALDQLIEKCSNGNVEAIPLMLHKSERLVSILINHQHSVFGTTLLMTAAANNAESVVLALLQAGANPNLKDSSNATAIQGAIGTNKLEIVKHLLDFGAQLPAGVNRENLISILKQNGLQVRVDSSTDESGKLDKAKEDSKPKGARSQASKKGASGTKETKNQKTAVAAKDSRAPPATKKETKPFVWGQQQLPKPDLQKSTGKVNASASVKSLKPTEKKQTKNQTKKKTAPKNVVETTKKDPNPATTRKDTSAPKSKTPKQALSIPPNRTPKTEMPTNPTAAPTNVIPPPSAANGSAWQSVPTPPKEGVASSKEDWPAPKEAATVEKNTKHPAAEPAVSKPKAPQPMIPLSVRIANQKKKLQSGK